MNLKFSWNLGGGIAVENLKPKADPIPEHMSFEVAGPFKNFIFYFNKGVHTGVTIVAQW